MTDLRARAAKSLKEFPAEDDAAADARSQSQQNAVGKPLARAIARFPESRSIGIIEDKRLFPGVFLHKRRKLHIFPAEIGPGNDDAVRAVDHPRRSDADRLDIVHALVCLFRRLQCQLRQSQRRPFRRIRSRRLHTAFSLQLIPCE